MISVFYLSRAKFLSPRAHLHNAIKTCEALQETNEIDITFIDCDKALKDEKSIADFFKLHNIKRKFKIISLNSPANIFKFKNIRFFGWLEVVFTNLTLIRFLFNKRKYFEVIYYRDHLLFLAVIFARWFLRKSVFFESHYIMKRWHGKVLTYLAIRMSSGVIAITDALNKRLKKYNKNIITIFCAAPEFFPPEIHNKNESREKLNLPSDKIIIGYTGNMSVTGLGESYGVEEIVGSLEYLSPDFIFVGVGDKVGEAQFLMNIIGKEVAKNRVIILPWQNREKMPEYLAVFDILVIPRAGGAPGNVPTKMYEYLAANKPIVACATEPILETMHDKENCLIVSSNSPREWADKIKEIYDDRLLRDKLIKRAGEDSRIHTWQNRAKLILNFIKHFYVEK
jgi:glycosyltransferase involved in cell wall biosynthesis